MRCSTLVVAYVLIELGSAPILRGGTSGFEKLRPPEQKRDNFRSDRYSQSSEDIAVHGWNPDDYIPKANASDSKTGFNDTGVLARIPLDRAPRPKTFSPDRSGRRPLVDLEGTVFLARDPLGLNEVSSQSQDPCERLFAAASAPKLRQQLQAIPLEDFSIKTFPWTEEALAAFVSADKREWTAVQAGKLRSAVYSAIEKIDTSPWLPELKRLSPEEYLEAKGGVSNKQKFVELMRGGENSDAVRRLEALSANIEQLTPHERKVLDALIGGADPETVKLYADLLYAQEGVKEELYQDVISCVKAGRERAAREFDRRSAAFEFDAQVRDILLGFFRTRVRDESLSSALLVRPGYATRQSLRKTLLGLDYKAKARVFDGPIEERLQLISGFLRDADELEQYYPEIGDVSKDILGLCDSRLISELELDAPSWEVMDLHGTLPELQGFFRDGSSVVLFIGDDTPRAIQIDADGEKKLMSVEEGASLFEKHCLEEIEKYSDPSISLFCTYKTPEGQVVQLSGGKNVLLSTQEVAQLKQGLPLPPEHELSKQLSSGRPYLLFSNPMMMKEGAAVRNAEAFAFSLQKSYPDSVIGLDPYSKETSKNFDALMKFKVKAPDIKVVITGASNPVPQGKTVINIAEELKEAQFDVTVFTGVEHYQGEPGKAVFIITGHSSEELGKLVQQLGKGEFFRDNFVILNSCNTPLTRQLRAEINGRYGGRVTWGFPSKIMASDVENYMLDLARRCSSGENRPLGRVLAETLKNHGMMALPTVCQVDTNDFSKWNNLPPNNIQETLRFPSLVQFLRNLKLTSISEPRARM